MSPLSLITQSDGDEGNPPERLLDCDRAPQEEQRREKCLQPPPLKDLRVGATLSNHAQKRLRLRASDAWNQATKKE
ncbi:hypothetical protein EYF80_046987 [Liparis tanakae]|uniref:Uncharacterized protein n=1 Tax=Liparis tanakae TaxID=230148 RepID=A0A4Z2FNT6_9TELE|nr:hypothetical protein EYF80_046987 [Liparis tanakae]